MKQLHPFDDLIRQRIDELPAALPSGWDELADRLDAPADAALAGKLATIAPAAAPLAGSWQDLAGKLDALEAAGSQHPLDATITTGLEQATPTAVSGWAQLAARLELTGRRREMVACVTITEAALMLSFLVLMLRFGPVTRQVHPPQPTADLLNGTSFPVGLAESTGVQPEAVEARAAAKASVATTADDRKPAIGLIPSAVYIEQIGHPPVLPAIIYDGVDAVDGVALNNYRVAGTTPLPAPTAPELLPNGAPVHYYLNLFVSPVDVNDVFTFQNRSIGVLNDRRILSTGFSAGLLFDVTQEKNGLQTGIIYGKRSYVPAEILNLEEDTQTTNPADDVRYGRLTYHTVSLPLNYQREFSASDKWRVSAGVGLAMNVILQSEFRLTSDASLEDLDQAVDFFVNNLNKSGKPSGRTASARSISEVRRPDPGYLEGGSLLENSSLYLSGTLQLERIVNNRMSFYVSPTVSRLVTISKFDGGKGPLEDRIHNTMFRFGTRIRLTNK